MVFLNVKKLVQGLPLKIFYVAFVFLFGIYGTSAFAVNPLTIYAAMNPEDGEMGLDKFGPSMGVAGGFEIIMKGVCGGESSIDSIYTQRTKQCAPLVDDAKTRTALLEKGIMPGGLAYHTAYIAGDIINDPMVPTNMALFIEDTFKDNIFGVDPIYAQGLSDLSRPRDMVFTSIAFNLWKQMRNLSLAMVGVLLAVGALGIMFRQKLSPQAVVTIGNVLPHLPIALIAIVLSYPIVTVFLNLVEPLNDISRTIAQTIAEGLWANVTFQSGVTVAAQATLNPYTIIAAVLSFTAGGWWVAGGLISFFLLLVTLVMLVTALVVLIKFLFESGKVFITWVIITVMFPVIAAFSILPGKQGSLIFVFKKLLANLLVLPIMWLTLLVGLAIMMTMFEVASTANAGVGAFDQMAFFFGKNIFIPIMKFMIGIVFIWQGLGARKHIETALGVTGSVMSAIMPQEQRR